MENIENELKDIEINLRSAKQTLCMNCGRELRKFDGKYGKFMGCSNWPKDKNCNTTYAVKENI